MSDTKNNLNRSAVGLKYNALKHKAPRVTAKGKGLMAERIIALARANNVPIKEDPDLVHLLAQVDLNREIPSSLYQIVAELLTFVYKLNQNYPPKAE